MKRNLVPRTAWIAAGLIVITSLVNIALRLINLEPGISLLKLANDIAWLSFPIVYGLTGALIITHQPRNAIGWLLLFPALFFNLPETSLQRFDPVTPPAQLSVGGLLFMWFDNWSWILFIFPVLFIPLLFPNGRLPSPRWRWVFVLAGAMALTMMLLVTFAKEIAPMNVEVNWSIKNPIGFIGDEFFKSPFFNVPWSVALIGLTVACVSALFLRYRRGTSVERAQIRWLLYACVLFTPIYSVSGLSQEGTIRYYLLDVLFIISVIAMPVAITIAILRHRLFDIDILIRKTLVYALLSGLLGLTFWGSVVVLQMLFTAITGNQSQAAVVISTLGMAAIFSPLRSRIQGFIDRRFFRAKYDAAKLLADFAHLTRNETDLRTLSDRLAGVVQETMQPESTSLWLLRRKAS